MLAEAAKRLMPPDGAPFIGACDATGLRTSRASYYFVRRLREMGQRVRRRAWLKYSLQVEVRRRAILAQRAGLGPCSDIPELPLLWPAGPGWPGWGWCWPTPASIRRRTTASCGR